MAAWGLAFKPNTDDMREAPSRVIVEALLARGATVVAYDPVAMDEARRVFGPLGGLSYAASPLDACDGADALVIVTEWKEFRSRRLRCAQGTPQVTGDLRRPQPLRSGAGQGSRLRVFGRRPSLTHLSLAATTITTSAVMNTNRFSSFRDRASRAHLLVVGDVMLDRYWFGDVERISPEAPVPVVKVARTEERPGGAANVARNAAALGAAATLLSVIGDDEPGAALERLLVSERVRASFHRDASLATTVKLRVIGRQQQLLRIDFETAPSARDPGHQARRLRAAVAGRRPCHPVGLREGWPDPHRDDDRARPKRGQGRSGRPEGRRLRALPWRDADHPQSQRAAPGGRPLEG